MTPNLLIHPATRLGHVHYITANLDRQVEFYTEILGLRLNWTKSRQAGLGAGGEDLLVITEIPGAAHHPGTTGMYHFALLVPDRKELARVIARLYHHRIPHSPTDHVISKTTYVDDPDGNTIEIYAYSLEDGSFTYRDGGFDARWSDGRPSSGREPLDLEKLFMELEAGDDIHQPFPETTMMGHVHLFGNDLRKQMVFYRDVLGFRDGGLGEKIGMAEVALERPHVIAFNTWQGESARRPPENSLGVKYFSIILPTPEALNEVLDRIRGHHLPFVHNQSGVFIQDPSGIDLRLDIQD